VQGQQTRLGKQQQAKGDGLNHRERKETAVGSINDDPQTKPKPNNDARCIQLACVLLPCCVGSCCAAGPCVGDIAREACPPLLLLLRRLMTQGVLSSSRLLVGGCPFLSSSSSSNRTGPQLQNLLSWGAVCRPLHSGRPFSWAVAGVTTTSEPASCGNNNERVTSSRHTASSMGSVDRRSEGTHGAAGDQVITFLPCVRRGKTRGGTRARGQGFYCDQGQGSTQRAQGVGVGHCPPALGFLCRHAIRRALMTRRGGRFGFGLAPPPSSFFLVCVGGFIIVRPPRITLKPSGTDLFFTHDPQTPHRARTKAAKPGRQGAKQQATVFGVAPTRTFQQIQKQQQPTQRNASMDSSSSTLRGLVSALALASSAAFINPTARSASGPLAARRSAGEYEGGRGKGGAREGGVCPLSCHDPRIERR
jgi:hypothetical protein